MAILLTGSGSLGQRLGALFGGTLDAMALAGGPVTARVLSGSKLTTRCITTLPTDFSGGTALPQIINSAPNITTQLVTYQNNLGQIARDFSTAAANCLRAMAAIDTQGTSSGAPLATFLGALSLPAAVAILISQMTINTTTVQSGTVAAGAQTSVGTPIGNPILNLSMFSPQGLAWALSLPETITFSNFADSLTGGRPLGCETFNAFGQPTVPPLAYNWPGGSACNINFNAVRGDYSNTNGNALVNGNMTVFSTANYPDNWVIPVGTPGTSILNGGAVSYLTPGGSIEFVGSATLNCIIQPFNTTSETGAGLGGTPFAIQPNTVYHGCIFYKLDSASPAAGVLKVSLVDGSAGIGTVINNDAGTANTATLTLTSVADTNWHAFTFAFQTPENLPITIPAVRLRISITTGLSAGTDLFMSNISFTQAQSLYPGGPWASMHSGNVRSLAGLAPDTWTSAITNNYATSGDGLFHFCLERAFQAAGYSLQQAGLQLPVTGSPTIADSLVA